MEPRILLISTYPELTESAKKLSRKLSIPIVVHEGGILKDGHLYAKSAENDFDVIISVAATAAAIERMVNIPVVPIEISAIDVLGALLKAMEYGGKIALVSHRTEELYGIEGLKNMLNVDFEVFPYSNKSELEKQIEDTMAKEKLTIVGMGGCFVELAEERQLNGVSIKCSIRSISKALISAKNICELGKREKEKAERLKTIIDYSGEGIIAIDNMKNITTFNHIAEKIFNINASDAIGHPIVNFEWASELGDIYEDCRQELGRIVKINNIQAVLNKVPICVDNEHVGVIFTLQEVTKLQKLEQKVRTELYSKGLVAKYTFNDITGKSTSIINAIDMAIRFGKTNTTVLIEGETGSGKELFAQSIHNISARKNGPFVAVNCAAFPENLLESELFGYEEGAFTGARKGGKLGLFELAHGGTIFLDEIGEIPLSLQTRLLRVLQERMILKIGSDRIINIDIRVIAASNKDLYRLVREGKFREDLFFRLNVLNLRIPPLRERKEDINILMGYFIRIMNRKHGSRVEYVTDKGIELLKTYSWPGNIRELESFAEKMVILSNRPVIDEGYIRQLLMEQTTYKNAQPINEEDDKKGIIIEEGYLKDMELQIIEAVSKSVKGDKSVLAERLGISRTTLWKRLKELEEYQSTGMHERMNR